MNYNAFPRKMNFNIFSKEYEIQHIFKGIWTSIFPPEENESPYIYKEIERKCISQNVGDYRALSLKPKGLEKDL